MRIAVFFDTHIKSDSLKRINILNEITKKERMLGSKIVWGGDILDLVEDSTIDTRSLEFIKPGDVYILGNHDPIPIPGLLNTYYFKTENSFIIHGDQLDVQYVLVLFELTFKGKLVKRETAYDIYKGLVQLPDYLVNLVKNSFYKLLRKEPLEIPSLKNFLLFWPLIFKIIGEQPLLFHHPEEIIEFPIYTLDPKVILEKIFYMEPEAKNFKNIIIGHLHPENLIKYENGNQALFVSPSMDKRGWGYFVIENESVEFVNVC